jgi:chorismate-pyruvate lyase
MDLLYPLSEYYAEAGAPLPKVAAIDGAAMPEPYRSLLAHERDMTPTLEEACGGPVELRVLKYSLREDVFSRLIVLAAAPRGTLVEFGAIKIYLDRFPAAARDLIVAMKQPLGTILRTEGIAHASRPAGYFEVISDGLIGAALRLEAPARLYGRRNVLRDAGGGTLARVIEILPPNSGRKPPG